MTPKSTSGSAIVSLTTLGVSRTKPHEALRFIAVSVTTRRSPEATLRSDLPIVWFLVMTRRSVRVIVSIS
jgi:hypothetical protein